MVLSNFRYELAGVFAKVGDGRFRNVFLKHDDVVSGGVDGLDRLLQIPQSMQISATEYGLVGGDHNRWVGRRSQLFKMRVDAVLVVREAVSDKKYLARNRRRADLPNDGCHREEQTYKRQYDCRE